MTWLTISRGFKNGWRTVNGVLLVALTLLSIGAHAARAQKELAEAATQKSVVQQKPVTLAPWYDFYARPPYRAAVPKPDDLLGYSLGTWHSTFRDQERVLFAIANAAPDRVRVWEYGKSIEGRPLRVFAISSPENIAALDSIREKNLRLADPRTLSNSDADSIIKTNPALVWINECIHGSETASFETAMATLYTLAASDAPEITDALKNTVVILNPVFNPDGHERYVVYVNAAANGSADSFSFEQSIPWLSEGRFNHNRFDMNRDKIAQSQPETRQETKEFLRWFPQVFVDQHGQPENYFFPPNAKATNPNVDIARVAKWTDTFGKANGAAFDQRGWAYVNREVFDFFYPGYLDSFTTLCGSIGMTYETDGGGSLARRRSDGTISTLRDATAHHFETALATIETSAKNREGLLKEFLAYKRSALDLPAKTAMRRVILSPTRDPQRAAELVELLLRLGIEVQETSGPLTTEGVRPYEAKPGTKTEKKTFPTGTLVIDLAQPQGHLAQALLEGDTEMEPEFVKAQLARRERNAQRNPNESEEGYEFYDTTAWSLPYLYDLDAFTLAAAPPIPGAKRLALEENGEVKLAAMTALEKGDAVATPVAYAIPLDSDNAVALAMRLLQSGCRLSVATNSVTVNGKAYRAGTLFARVARNPDLLPSLLTSLSTAMGVRVESLPSAYGNGPEATGLGSESISALKAPRIAVLEGDGIAQTGYGSVAFTLNQAKVRFTSIPLRALKNTTTRNAFNVIVLPDGFGYKNNLGKETISSLKDWVNAGGCLVGLAGGATWMTDKEVELTSVRPVGEEESEEGEEKKDGKKDKNNTPLSLPGALFRAKIRPDHFLGYGYPEGTVPVPLSGDTFWKLSETGGNVVTFPVKGPSRLSGFVWPDNTEKLLAGTAYAVDEPTGQGHVLLFLQDPTDRYLYIGLRRMFLSGLLFGPQTDAGADAYP